MPYASSFARASADDPIGRPRRRVRRANLDRPDAAAPRARAECRVSISRIAGHPEYVGVTVTDGAAFRRDSTSRTIPSSTTLSTGTSGSITVSRISNSSSRDGSARFTMRHPDASARRSASPTSMCPRCSVCLPVAAAALHVADRRNGQRRAREHLRPPARCHALGERARDPRRVRPSLDLAIDGVGDEQLARVAPQLIDGALRARMALVRAVAERDHPLRAVAHVVARLLDRLGGDAGELGVARSRQSASICSSEKTLKNSWRTIVNAKSPFGSSTSSAFR